MCNGSCCNHKDRACRFCRYVNWNDHNFRLEQYYQGELIRRTEMQLLSGFPRACVWRTLDFPLTTFFATPPAWLLGKTGSGWWFYPPGLSSADNNAQWVVPSMFVGQDQFGKSYKQYPIINVPTVLRPYGRPYGSYRFQRHSSAPLVVSDSVSSAASLSTIETGLAQVNAGLLADWPNSAEAFAVEIFGVEGSPAFVDAAGDIDVLMSTDLAFERHRFSCKGGHVTFGNYSFVIERVRRNSVEPYVNETDFNVHFDGFQLTGGSIIDGEDGEFKAVT